MDDANYYIVLNNNPLEFKYREYPDVLSSIGIVPSRMFIIAADESTAPIYFQLTNGDIYAYDSSITKLENCKIECLKTDKGYYKMRIIKKAIP